MVVLPELSRDSHTHYAHYLRLLEEIAKLAELVVVVEKGGAPDVPGLNLVAQRRTGPLGRAGELALLLIRLRRLGFAYAYGSYSPYFGIVGGLTGRLVGIRTYYWHCRSDFFGLGIGRRPTPQQILREIAPFVLSLHLCTVVVTGTERLARRYARAFLLGRTKVRVVPNDIDLRSFVERPGSARDSPSPTLLFVHRLTEHQGSRLLAPIFFRISERIPDARLVVAGGGPDEQLLREQFASELGDRRVELLGYVPNSTVRRLLRKADLLLLPSLTEGFPRVLLEAMACGVPFVASRVGGIPEIVPPDAEERLVPPGQVEAFAREAVALIEDRSLRERLANEGIRHVRRYDVRRVARAFVDEVCGRP